MSPPSSFPEAWGGVAVSILVSAMLSGGINMQALSYYSRFQKDPLGLKCAIAVIWLCSFLRVMFNFWVLHSCLILGYNLPLFEVVVPLGFSIAVVLEVIVHATTQGIYIFRIYRFGQNPYFIAPCCILVLVELGLGFTWAGRIAIGDAVLVVDARNRGIKWDITSFFTISAFIDVFITMSVSYQLFRSRMSGLKRTKHLIDRIIRWTLPTGLLTSSVAITIVFTWNLKQDSFLWAGICSFAPECYAISLLTLLNSRRPGSNIAESGSLSLSMATLSTLPTHTSTSCSSITATTARVYNSSPSSEKVAEQAKFQSGRGDPNSSPSFPSY